MCRNIKRLRHGQEPPSDEELHNAALQFVRKISGFQAPSQTNQASFDRAVHDVAAVSRVLFDSLQVRGRSHHHEEHVEAHSGTV
jgi:hypothetical protein